MEIVYKSTNKKDNPRHMHTPLVAVQDDAVTDTDLGADAAGLPGTILSMVKEFFAEESLVHTSNPLESMDTEELQLLSGLEDTVKSKLEETEKVFADYIKVLSEKFTKDAYPYAVTFETNSDRSSSIKIIKVFDFIFKKKNDMTNALFGILGETICFNYRFSRIPRQGEDVVNKYIGNVKSNYNSDRFNLNSLKDFVSSGISDKMFVSSSEADLTLVQNPLLVVPCDSELFEQANDYFKMSANQNAEFVKYIINNHFKKVFEEEIAYSKLPDFRNPFWYEVKFGCSKGFTFTSDPEFFDVKNGFGVPETEDDWTMCPIHNALIFDDSIDTNIHTIHDFIEALDLKEIQQFHAELIDDYWNLPETTIYTSVSFEFEDYHCGQYIVKTTLKKGDLFDEHGNHLNSTFEVRYITDVPNLPEYYIDFCHQIAPWDSEHESTISRGANNRFPWSWFTAYTAAKGTVVDLN